MPMPSVYAFFVAKSCSRFITGDDKGHAVYLSEPLYIRAARAATPFLVEGRGPA